MVRLKPFKGIRPVKEKAKEVASKPYDVLDAKEARKEAEGNPNSFYHVVKPEIDFPDEHDHYSPEIYKKGKENFAKLINDGSLFQDKEEYLYLYQQTMDGRKQTGLVGCASVDDYFAGTIKIHELTRPDKEEDRKNHVRFGNMNAEPVFFAYPAVKGIDDVIEEITTEEEPEYDFTSEDGIQHTFWVIKEQDLITEFVQAFEKINSTYVADGHHRTAAAALVGKELRDKNPKHTGQEEYNYFLAVHFPDKQLRIFDYNRVIKDLNGLSPEQFINKLKDNFEVKKKGTEAYRPKKLHEFGMYLEGFWYSLSAKPNTYDDNDPIGVLDVTVLSNKILEPLLGIKDLRTDKRIDFVGGIRGLNELSRRVDNGEMKVAFALYPVTMDQLMNIADTGNLMPPKTTWFEPKLRSGLIVHSLD